MSVLPVRSGVPVKPALAVGTDGRVYAQALDVRGTPRMSRAVSVLEAGLGGEVFVGVVVPGLTLGRLLTRLDDAGAEIVATSVGRQRRRRTERRI